eukprot:scaffold323457_cov86-Attheya_sp.AAC.1
MNYLQLCLDSRMDFTHHILSVDGQIANHHWKTRTYSKVCGWVNAWVSTAIPHATHLCLRGSQVPVKHISSRWSTWDDGAARLGLFRSYCPYGLLYIAI